MNYETADRILAGLTARQMLVLGTAGLAAWALFVSAARGIGAIGAGLLCLPLIVLGGVLAAYAPDGTPMDRFALNVMRQGFTRKRRVLAPYGHGIASRRLPQLDDAIRIPLRCVSRSGFIRLGTWGSAVIASASGVNFRLRSEPERAALAASFVALMHSLDAPIQFLVTARPVDADASVSRIEQGAAFLPHPGLTEGAADYVTFFRDLVGGEDVLRHETFICLRDPDAQADSDLARRVANVGERAREMGVRVQRLEGECLGLVASMIDPLPRGGSQ